MLKYMGQTYIWDTHICQRMKLFHFLIGFIYFILMLYMHECFYLICIQNVHVCVFDICTYYMSLWLVMFLFVLNMDTVLYFWSFQAVLLEMLVQWICNIQQLKIVTFNEWLKKSLLVSLFVRCLNTWTTYSPPSSSHNSAWSCEAHDTRSLFEMAKVFLHFGYV